MLLSHGPAMVFPCLWDPSMGCVAGWRWGNDHLRTGEAQVPPEHHAGCPHSSVLAWRIPGTGELGGLPSLGSHRVGHN